MKRSAPAIASMSAAPDESARPWTTQKSLRSRGSHCSNTTEEWVARLAIQTSRETRVSTSARFRRARTYAWSSPPQWLLARVVLITADARLPLIARYLLNLLIQTVTVQASAAFPDVQRTTTLFGVEAFVGLLAVLARSVGSSALRGGPRGYPTPCSSASATAASRRPFVL